MPVVVLMEDDSSNLEVDLPLKTISTPLLCDMEDTYGASKVHSPYSGAIGTIKLNDFIQKFNIWCDMQQLRNPHLLTPFLTWKGLFQHLEGPPMDDYHEFC